MQAVIFDFDGTLLDSETEWDKYLRPLAEKAFPEMKEEDFNFATGSTTGQFYVYLSGIYQPTMTFQEYSEEIRNFIPALYASAPLSDGVRELLEALKEAGIPMAIATSSQRAWILPSIASHNIAEFFQAVVTLDDVKEHKPHPEPYLLAAEKLGVDPTKCIAVEDSVHGIQSAKSAGMFCIGHAYRDNAKELHEANMCVASFLELDVQKLESLSRGSKTRSA